MDVEGPIVTRRRQSPRVPPLAFVLSDPSAPRLNDLHLPMPRAHLLILVVLLAAGLALGWNKGRLPERPIEPATSGEARTAPDLRLYREVVDEVRRGNDYYQVARQKIPQFGFPITSPLNWRLPTYAWVLALLPDRCSRQAALLGLSLVSLVLAFYAQRRTSPTSIAAASVFLLFGVVRWAFDGEAYLAQEPWAATLIVISLSAHALGGRWRALAVACGTAALLFRELALPYCGVACLCAAWNRRWWESAAWAAGIALFFCFFAWHVGQVRGQLAGSETTAASAGLAQWLRFGGLDFVLLTTRMNGLLFAAPAGLLWLYLLAALWGLAQRCDETSRLACLAALAYVSAFAIVGRSENFYWGLLPAPLLAWGAAHAAERLITSIRPPQPLVAVG